MRHRLPALPPGALFAALISDAQHRRIAERLRRAGIRTRSGGGHHQLRHADPRYAAACLRCGQKCRALSSFAKRMRASCACSTTAKRPLRATAAYRRYRKALAIAGVMGGADSAAAIRRRTSSLKPHGLTRRVSRAKRAASGLASDSAQRGRGVDYTLQSNDQNLATRLITEICGGEARAITLSVSATDLPQRSAITLQRAAIARWSRIRRRNRHSHSGRLRRRCSIPRWYLDNHPAELAL